MLKIGYVLEELDEKLFEKTFCHTSVELADKLMDTTSKEENQMLVNDIKINRDKIFEQDEKGKFAIYPPYKRGDLLDTIKAIIRSDLKVKCL